MFTKLKELNMLERLKAVKLKERLAGLKVHFKRKEKPIDETPVVATFSKVTGRPRVPLETVTGQRYLYCYSTKQGDRIYGFDHPHIGMVHLPIDELMPQLTLASRQAFEAEDDREPKG